MHATFPTRSHHLATLFFLFLSYHKPRNSLWSTKREKNNVYTKNSVQILFDGIERNDWPVFGKSNDIDEIQCTSPIKWYKVLCVLYILFAFHSLINFHYLIQKQLKITSFTCIYVSSLPFSLRIKVDSAARCQPPTKTTITEKRKDN